MRLLALSALALLGCKDYEALCAADDPSVTAATCWREGWRDGYVEGETDAYDLAFDDGYAACLEDYDAL
ncbi:MAG: hypothetical protein Q8P41_23595 [Pseudomonadota bacterium]|nr:hypothetical protein [Pseudomonadota bacterium]